MHINTLISKLTVKAFYCKSKNFDTQRYFDTIELLSKHSITNFYNIENTNEFKHIHDTNSYNILYKILTDNQNLPRTLESFYFNRCLKNVTTQSISPELIEFTENTLYTGSFFVNYISKLNKLNNTLNQISNLILTINDNNPIFSEIFVTEEALDSYVKQMNNIYNTTNNEIHTLNEQLANRMIPLFIEILNKNKNSNNSCKETCLILNSTNLYNYLITKPEFITSASKLNSAIKDFKNNYTNTKQKNNLSSDTKTTNKNTDTKNEPNKLLDDITDTMTEYYESDKIYQEGCQTR